MLQCVAMCCSVLQCVQCVTMCYSVTVGCNVLQCVAACCSALQCVPVSPQHLHPNRAIGVKGNPTHKTPSPYTLLNSQLRCSVFQCLHNIFTPIARLGVGFTLGNPTHKTPSPYTLLTMIMVRTHTHAHTHTHTNTYTQHSQTIHSPDLILSSPHRNP